MKIILVHCILEVVIIINLEEKLQHLDPYAQRRIKNYIKLQFIYMFIAKKCVKVINKKLVSTKIWHKIQLSGRVSILEVYIQVEGK